MQKKKPLFKPNCFPLTLGILIILLVMVCWLNFGPLLSFSILAIPGYEESPFAPVLDYLVVHAPFLLMFLSLFLGSNYVLKTKLRVLISGSEKTYRYKYSFIVGGIYIAIMALIALCSIGTTIIDPAPLSKKLMFVLPVLIFTPMQAISEEVFFRVLPCRLIFKDQMPKRRSEQIALSIALGLIFMMPHLGNNEVQLNSSAIVSLLYYFLWGSLAAALSIYTDGFEAPVAMHIANNLFIALIVNQANSSMPTNAIFLNTNSEFSSLISIIQLLLLFLVVLATTYFIKKKRPSLLEKDNREEESFDS